jgi:protein-disulfide isomerase
MKKYLPYIALAAGLILIGVGFAVTRPTPDATPEQKITMMDQAAGTAGTPTDAEATLERAAAITEQAATPAPVEATPKPTVMPKGRFIGADNAPVKIIEFASLTCGHCAHFHNKILDELRVKYVDTGLVQIEFRPFPLNKPALDATLLVGCMPEERYYPFLSMLFQTQDHWAFTGDYLDILKQNAKLAGLSDEKIDSCLNDKAAQEALAAQMKADAEKYQVSSTPTFVLNDGKARVIGALPLVEFSKQIDPLLPPSTPSSSTETPAPTETAAP